MTTYCCTLWWKNSLGLCGHMCRSSKSSRQMRTDMNYFNSSINFLKSLLTVEWHCSLFSCLFCIWGGRERVTGSFIRSAEERAKVQQNSTESSMGSLLCVFTHLWLCWKTLFSRRVKEKPADDGAEIEDPSQLVGGSRGSLGVQSPSQEGHPGYDMASTPHRRVLRSLLRIVPCER